MSGSVGLIAAFAGGVVSFLSPCVLPLIPAYLSFITGLSVGELGSSERRAVDIAGPLALFVAGFTIVFVGLGATASVLGALLNQYRDGLTVVAGGIVVVLGVLLLDIIPVPFLRRGVHFDVAKTRRFGNAAALALGLVFPFAIGPCAGFVYGAILTMAGNTGQVAQGALLLFVYSLGLATPFVVTGVLFGRFASRLRFLVRYSHAINRVAGVMLIAIGVLVVTGLMGPLSGLIGDLVPAIEL